MPADFNSCSWHTREIRVLAAPSDYVLLGQRVNELAVEGENIVTKLPLPDQGQQEILAELGVHLPAL